MSNVASGAGPASPEQPRILLVADSAADAELVLRELERSGVACTTLRVQSEAALRDGLRSFPPDLVLADHGLPGFNASDALRVVRETARQTPVIVVAGSLDEETAAEFIKAGAADYIAKHRLQRLGPAVRQALALRRALEGAARAEAARRRSMEFLRHTQAVAHVGSWDWDLAGDVITWSEETYHIFGLAPSDGPISYERYLALIHPEDRVALKAAAGRALETLEPFEINHRIIRPDGSVRFLYSRGGVVSDSTGRPARLTGVVLDITARKQAEDALQRAEKMEAVGRLAAGVAHDFNNLLTAILGSGELLLELLPAGHAGREDAAEIRKAALRAADLTRQLLAFSRQQVLAPRVLNANDVVTGMDAMLRRVIGADVVLRTVLAADLGAVRADPGQLEQVIVTLAGNARDAMPQGGTLTIETANVVLREVLAAGRAVVPGSYVMVAVTDTGAGMDADTQARAFEPFFTTKPTGKGTGLGLATVYGMVQQSGGYVWLDSEVGRGTTVKVCLPRIAATPEPVAAAAAAVGSLRGSETILLVDDQDDVRALIRRILEKQGYRVLVAAHGSEALVVAGEHGARIDLLVTDVVMPGMSGGELSSRLVPLHPGMRVLYLSGYTNEAILDHGVFEPGIGFLQKPFTPESLARKVREVLGPAK